MSTRLFAALLFCAVLAGGAVDARKFSFGGRKLAQALIDTSKLVALPELTLPNIGLPQNIQVLSNADSGNTQTGRKLAEALIDTSKLVALPELTLPNVGLPQNVQVLSNADSGNTQTGRKLSQLVDASSIQVPKLPNVDLPKNIQVLSNSNAGNTDTTGYGR